MPPLLVDIFKDGKLVYKLQPWWISSICSGRFDKLWDEYKRVLNPQYPVDLAKDVWQDKMDLSQMRQKGGEEEWAYKKILWVGVSQSQWSSRNSPRSIDFEKDYLQKYFSKDFVQDFRGLDLAWGASELTVWNAGRADAANSEFVAVRLPTVFKRMKQVRLAFINVSLVSREHQGIGRVPWTWKRQGMSLLAQGGDNIKAGRMVCSVRSNGIAT